MDACGSSDPDSNHRKRVRTLSPDYAMDSTVDPTRALPSETFLHVLSFLEPPSLTRSARVSRTWNEACSSEALWRALAIRLGYCQSERAAEERNTGTRVVASVLQKYEAGQDDSRDLLEATIDRYRSRNTTTFFDDCDTWRSLCCRLWRLGCNWSPSEPASYIKSAPSATIPDLKSVWPELEIKESRPRESALSSMQTGSTLPLFLFPSKRVLLRNPDGAGVWRCKIDPEERTIIMTCQIGGIQVLDHSTKTLLWHIPRTATRPFPHLEFSRGWMIFDRPGIGHFEVWRSERLVPDLGRAPDRGHFQRYTILSSTRPIRAYRFQFPYLCAASQDGFVMIWNVPQQEVVETIDFRNSSHRESNINYIDFDDDFVFLVGLGAKSVSVFSRHTRQLVWNMGQHFASGAAPPATWRLEEPSMLGNTSQPFFCDPAFRLSRLVRAPPGAWQAGPNVMNLAQLTMTPFQIWSAVHPDPKTKTLLVLGQGTLLLIRDYKKFFNNPKRSPDLFVEIEFDNLDQYYQRHILGGEEDWSDLGWNSRRLWESRGDAQLTVHEGKAAIINEFFLILDLDPVSAALHAGCSNAQLVDATNMAMEQTNATANPAQSEDESPPSSSPDTEQNNSNSTRDGASAEEAAPPILVYAEVNRPPQDTYQNCSSVQMDEVGIYVAVDTEVTASQAEEGSGEYGADEVTGDARCLVHFDFSQRRHELHYHPSHYPHLDSPDS